MLLLLLLCVCACDAGLMSSWLEAKKDTSCSL
jgi:hypothetical protein